MNIMSEKFVITRKAHECWGCHRKFDKGSNMSKQVATDMGGIWTTYTCETCHKLIKLNPIHNGCNVFYDDGDGFGADDILETMEELGAGTPEELLLLFKKQSNVR